MLLPGVPLDHLGYAVPDLHDAMARFSGLLGLQWDEPSLGFSRDFLDRDSLPVDWRLDVVFSHGGEPPAEIAVELLRGDPGTTWFSPDMIRLHHVAYRVPDVPDICAELTTQGWRLDLRHADAEVRPMSFAYLAHPDHAQRIELLPLREGVGNG